MARMRAVDAAVLVLEKEGIGCAFGVPGAAINPLYSALRARAGIRHILARHVEAASHMAEGYTRAAAGNIGLCLGTSGPGGTDMITDLMNGLSGIAANPAAVAAPQSWPITTSRPVGPAASNTCSASSISAPTW